MTKAVRSTTIQLKKWSGGLPEGRCSNRLSSQPPVNRLRPTRRSRMRRVRRVRAAAGSVLFLAVAPGVIAGFVPWLLTEWRPAGAPAWLQALGWIALTAGAAVLLEAFGRFVVEGIGTPAPIAPPERLVNGGLYRYVRNSMYL